MTRRRKTAARLAAGIALAVPLAGCITVKTPEKPIDVNLNVDIKLPARGFRDACAKEGILVGRDFPPMEKNYARISLGRMEDMEKAMPFFKQVLGKTSV